MAKRPNPPVPAPHDASCKALFEHPIMIESLFIHGGEALGLPPDLPKFLNFPEAEVVSPETISRKLKRRTNDLVIKIPALLIPLFDGISVMDDVHLLLELQSWKDETMPVRMMQYFKGIFRRLWRRKPKGVVPQLLCFVLNFSNEDWPGPKVPLVSVYDNNRPGMQIPGSFPEHRINLKTLDVTGMPEDRPFPALCRIEQAKKFETVRAVLKAIFTKYSGSVHDEFCEAMFNRAMVLGWFSKDKERKTHVSYEEARRNIEGDIPMPEIMTNIDQMIEDGRQAGLQAGRQEKHELLGRQAAKRFNGRTAKRLDTMLKDIDDPDVLAKIADAIIDCNTGKEFIDLARALALSEPPRSRARGL